MRIRIKWSGSDCGSPCGTTTYGEVEDYSINVVGWLLVSPTGGTIAPGYNQVLDVTFDATDLAVGVYTADILLNSNDPGQPLVYCSSNLKCFTWEIHKLWFLLLHLILEMFRLD